MPNILFNLDRLGLTLPEPPKPVASYVPASLVCTGCQVYISGQIPMKDGQLLATGVVPHAVSLEKAQECARQCVLNGLAALKEVIGSFERLRGVIRVGVFVACDASFQGHSKVANGASDLLVELLGESGRHTRAAVGCPSLPLNAPVEVEFLFLVD